VYSSKSKKTNVETVKTSGTDYIAQEIAIKVQYYNILREMTHAY
jgi:hypothetical protein